MYDQAIILLNIQDEFIPVKDLKEIITDGHRSKNTQ